MWSHLWLILSAAATISAAHVANYQDPLAKRTIERRAPQSCSAITPVPTKLVCGEIGYLKGEAFDSSFAAPQVVDSFETCRNFCLSRTLLSNSRNPGHSLFCNSFGYDRTSSKCYLSTKTLVGKQSSHFHADNSSSTEYWNSFCYKCPARCPQAEGINLLDNPGFELSSVFMGPWAGEGKKDKGSNFGYITPHGHDSTNAWTPGSNCDLIQYFNACPGKLYTFSYDLHIGQSSKGPPYLGFIFVGELSAELEAMPPGNSSWSTMEYSFRASHDIEHLRDSLPKADNYNFFIDNLVVAPAPDEILTLPQGNNLLVNGDFESGELTPWTFSEPYSIVSPGLTQHSKYAFMFKSNATSPVFQIFLDQDTPNLKPFGKYLITLNYKVEGSTYGPQVIAAGAGWDLTNYVDPEPIDANGVRTFQRIATNPDNSGLYVGLIFGGFPANSNDTLTIYIDNVSLLSLD